MGLDLFAKQVLATYDSLLKVGDNDTLTGTPKRISDGRGNDSPIWLGTTRIGIGLSPESGVDLQTNIGKFGSLITTSLRIDGSLTDSLGSIGSENQVLISTGSATRWASISAVSGVSGTGTTNTIPLWTSGTSIGNSLITQSGSTIDVNGKLYADLIQLSGGTGDQGTLSWNADEETLDIIQNGATLQVGQEIHIHCKNQTGSTIANGTPVYVTGTLGASGRLTIAPMIADASIPAKFFIGVTTETILNGDDGKVTTFGKIRGLNTSAYTEGQTLWVSATNAGLFQTTEPIAPDLKLEVGIVINSHVNNGTIFVRSTIGHYISQAHDVEVISPTNKDLLVYDTTMGSWVNSKTIGELSATNVTLSGYLRGPATFVIDPAAYGDETGLVQILGDLRVDGTTTTINSTTISVSDKNITLAKDAATAGDANGAGITIAGASATLTYLSATDDFTFNKVVNAAGFVGDLTGNADTADALSTARNIALDGSVTGNADFDGSGNITITTTTNHNHDDLYYTETESDAKYLLNTTDTLDGNLTVTGDLIVTGGIDLSNADLDIGSADIIFGTTAGGATRGLIWDVSGSGFLSKLIGGGADGGKVTLFANMDDAITTGNIFEIKDGSTGSLFLGLSHAGILTAGGGTSTQWNTAYGWGNHAGLYLPLAGKAADSNLLDGIDSTGFVRAYATTNDNIDSDWGQSFKTFDPIPSGTPPIASPNIRTINVGENYARRTQIAFDYATDRAWFRRRLESTWAGWVEFIHSGNIGSQSVNYASGAGNASTLNTLDSSQFLRSDESDTMAGSLTVDNYLSVGNAGSFGSGGNKITIGGYLDTYTSIYPLLTSNNHADFSFAVNLRLDSDHDLVTNVTHPTIKGGGIVIGGNGHPNGASTLNFYTKGVASTTAGTVYTAESAEMVLRDGKLGINNVSPSYKLDVNGESRLSKLILTNSNSPFTSSAILYSETGFNTVIGSNGQWSSSYAALKTNGDFVYIGNYFGIGTTNPDNKLTVNGSIGIQNSGSTEFHIAYYNGGLNFAESNIADYRFFIKDGGNVGVGTNSPSMFGSGMEIKTGGQSGLRLSSTTANGGAIEIGADSSSGYIQNVSVGDNTNFYTSNSTSADTLAMSIKSNGNVGIGTSTMLNNLGKTLQINTATTLMGYVGNSYFLNNWYYDSGGQSKYMTSGYASGYIQNSDGEHRFFTSAAGAAFENATVNLRAIIKNNGNFGINTDAPIDKFHIVGGVTSTSLQTPSNTSVGSLQIGYDGTKGVIRTWNSSPLLFSIYNYYQWDVSGSAAMYISTSRDVGIGTTSPVAKLDINSTGNNTRFNSLDSTGSYVTFANNGTAKAYIGSAYHLFSSPNNVADNLGIRSNAAMSFSTGGTTLAMHIDSSQRVGIGTNNPGVKLEVVGDMRLNTYMMLNASSTYMGQIGFNRNVATGAVFNPSYGAYQFHNYNGDFEFQVYNSAGSNVTIHRLFNNGNVALMGSVGIGTTSPAYKLDVAGNARISGGTIIQADAGNEQLVIARSSNGSEQLIIGFHSGDYAQIQAVEQTVAYRTLALNPNGGNVGIGTTDPSSKLEVNGNIGFTGDTTKYLFMPDVNQGTGSIYMQAGFGSATAGGAIRLYGHNATRNVGGDVEIGLSGKGDFMISRYIEGSRILTVKDAGNVQIGTTTNSTTGGFTDTTVLIKQKANGTAGGGLQIEQSNNDNIAFFGFTGSAFRIGTSYRTSGAYMPIELSTEGQTRIKIANNGDVGIGVTTMSAKLHVSNGANNAVRIDTTVLDNNTRDGIFLYEGDGQASGRQAISWYNGNQSYYKARLWTEVGSSYAATQFGIDVANDARTVATRLYIRNGNTFVNGTFTASGDVYAYSDARVKENVETIDNALDKVVAMRGVSYNRTDDDDKTKKVGVIAQEIQKVLPEVVSEQEDGMLRVSYGNIVGVLIEAIKEQQKQIDELKELLNVSPK